MAVHVSGASEISLECYVHRLFGQGVTGHDIGRLAGFVGLLDG